MLAAVIRATGPVSALGATFAALIPGVTHGLLGHAVVLDPARESETERLAEATGAGYVAGEDWRDGIKAARGEWLLLLDAGDLPAINWPAVVERYLQTTPQRPALMPLAGWKASLKERLAGRGLRAGLVVPHSIGLSGSSHAAPYRFPVRRERV